MTNTDPAPHTIALASATHPPLTVRDGDGRTLGYLVRRGDGFEAFDINGVSYGVFDSMKAAAFALPTRSES